MLHRITKNEAVAYSKHPLPWALPVPLRVHAHYTRAEIEAAFAVLTNDAPWIHREGVLWHQSSQTDLLPLHPLPGPGPGPLAVPLGKPEHHYRVFSHWPGLHPPRVAR